MTNAELIKALREARKHFWTQPQIELYPMMETAATMRWRDWKDRKNEEMLESNKNPTNYQQTANVEKEIEKERERESKPRNSLGRESVNGYEAHLGYCHGASITRHGFEKKLNVARTVTAREHKGVGNEPTNGVIYVRTANQAGRVELKNGGVADLTYPQSQTRRGRVIDKGNVSPTLCHTVTLFRVEVNDEM